MNNVYDFSKIYFFILHIFIQMHLFGFSQVQAHIIYNRSNPEQWIESVPHPNNKIGRLLQICENHPGTNQTSCETFPKIEGVISFGLFQGSDLDWNIFFDRCEDFDHSEEFEREVKMMAWGLTTMKATSAMGGLVNLYKKGRSWTSFSKQLAVSSAIGAASTAPVVVFDGRNYPRINARFLETVRERQFAYILLPGDASISQSSDRFSALEQTLVACSFRFDYWLIEKQRVKEKILRSIGFSSAPFGDTCGDCHFDDSWKNRIDELNPTPETTLLSFGESDEKSAMKQINAFIDSSSESEF